MSNRWPVGQMQLPSPSVALCFLLPVFCLLPPSPLLCALFLSHTHTHRGTHRALWLLAASYRRDTKTSLPLSLSLYLSLSHTHIHTNTESFCFLLLGCSSVGEGGEERERENKVGVPLQLQDQQHFIPVNGTTGEGPSLSVQERKQLAEEWVAKGKDKLDQIIIHVGALSLPESKGLAKHAAEIRADGIAVIAPSFFKQVNKDGLVAFLREVASEAPGIPFYYYHIPPLTGIKICVEELLDGMKEQIPTFQGVKFSDKDLLDFGRCVKKNNQGQLVLLYGVDEQLLSALIMGADGAVGSTYNYLGRASNLLLEAFSNGDNVLAQKYQFSTQESLSFVIAQGFGVAQTKAVMTLVSGIPMGPPRLPLLSASEEFIARVKARLEGVKNCPYS